MFAAFRIRLILGVYFFISLVQMNTCPYVSKLYKKNTVYVINYNTYFFPRKIYTSVYVISCTDLMLNAFDLRETNLMSSVHAMLKNYPCL